MWETIFLHLQIVSLILNNEYLRVRSECERFFYGKNNLHNLQKFVYTKLFVIVDGALSQSLVILNVIFIWNATHNTNKEIIIISWKVTKSLTKEVNDL